MASLHMFQNPAAINAGGGRPELDLGEAVRAIQLLQRQLRQSQELVADLRGQLNRAARRD
jgi:hypothetical protein